MMLDLFVSAFVTLFVIIDPAGCAPIFAGLTAGASVAQSRRMATKACLIAALILIVFALFGEALLGALHIELAAFRVAGGIMLFLIALEMVFERRTERRVQRADKVLVEHARAESDGKQEIEDISVFPMAMPMIAGPGSIATVMLLMARAQGTPETLVILAALIAVMALCLAALLAAPAMMRLMGESVEAVITRLLGVLLAALAAQYVIDGLKAMLQGSAG